MYLKSFFLPFSSDFKVSSVKSKIISYGPNLYVFGPQVSPCEKDFYKNINMLASRNFLSSGTNNKLGNKLGST